jgi:RpiB/LacA/LacB family sugar-phosphate isomerase
MIVALAADHGGYVVKEAIKQSLTAKGIEILDFGSHTADDCDYPDPGIAAAKAVGAKQADFAVLVCKSGIGMSITGNKVKGVRAALCLTVADAESARRHNHANAIAISGSRTTPEDAIKLVAVFISTAPEGGRHARRVGKIIAFEEGCSC